MTTNFNIPPPFTCYPPKQNDDDPSEEKSTERCAYELEEIPTKTPGIMQRKLKQRQMTMMAVGGTIGTGLFLGMGSALNDGGPMGLFLGYLIMGTVVWSVQTALGEMVTYLPCSGALTTFPTRFVDPALGFAVGWNYWYSFAVCVAGEVVAASIVVQYWKTPLSEGVWITIFFIAAGSINFFGVVCYGEMESLFAVLKIFAIVSLLISTIVLDLGGGPTHEFIGLKYWRNPGLFRQLDEIPGAVGRFLAFWSVFIQAAYSFLGTETVALAAAEAKNPRKTVPRAIKSVFYRLLLFYATSAFAIGLVVPFNEPQLLGGTGDASSSPFVIAIKRAQIKVLPDLINAIVLISAFSATSSQIYSGSRTLHGLVGDGMAPEIFGKVTTGGMPLNAIIATALPGLLAYMNLSTKSSVVFLWLVNLSAMTGIFTWWSVCLTYIRFHQGLKVQQVDRNTFDYKSSFQPYLSYYGLVMITAIILMNGFKVFLHGNWSWGSFIGGYITLPIFGLSYIFWKVYHKTKLVAFSQMKFYPNEHNIK